MALVALVMTLVVMFAICRNLGGNPIELIVAGSFNSLSNLASLCACSFENVYSIAYSFTFRVSTLDTSATVKLPNNLLSGTATPAVYAVTLFDQLCEFIIRAVDSQIQLRRPVSFK